MVAIGNRAIDNFGDPYIVAELGANHNGDMTLGRRLVDAAKACGCDCVKFQSWTKESIFVKDAYADPSLEDLLDRYSISKAQLAEMAAYCAQKDIDFACTPFSPGEVDFLVDELRVKFVKVASMDLNNRPFLDYVARQGCPVLLSTGMSPLDEIRSAVRTFERAHNPQLILLHCVSVYPVPDELVNLNNLDMLRKEFPEYPVGFSDHTLGIPIPLAAVAKGACVIEKHFTLDRTMEGWDHAVSAEPDEMRAIADGTRRIARALGSGERQISDQERENIPAYRRSLVAARTIEEGAVIAAEDLTAKRPGRGVPPDQISTIVGRRAKRRVDAGELLTQEDY